MKLRMLLVGLVVPIRLTGVRSTSMLEEGDDRSAHVSEEFVCLFPSSSVVAVGVSVSIVFTWPFGFVVWWLFVLRRRDPQTFRIRATSPQQQKDQSLLPHRPSTTTIRRNPSKGGIFTKKKNVQNR